MALSNDSQIKLRQVLGNAEGESVITNVHADAGTDDISNGAVTIAKLGAGVCQGVNLGAPSLATDNRYVASVTMKATAYTIANAAPPAGNPPRNITVTHTTDTTTDTLGSLVVVGTDYNGAVITETIALAADSVAAGTKCFKTVTSCTTAGWVIAGGVADTIKIGFGTLLGLPRVVTADANVFLAALDGAVRKPDNVNSHATLIEECAVDLSGGTYNGTKEARVILLTE